MKLWSRWILKVGSPTVKHVSRTHRVAHDWLFDRINLDPQIQIKYIDTKNQLADILTEGNFKRDEWNHLLTLFNISHFSSTACTAAMAKWAQQESGEERVTAKSRPMMILTSRAPSFVSSFSLIKPGEDLLWITRSWKIWAKWRWIGETCATRQSVNTRGLWSILVFSIVEKVELPSPIDRGNLRKILGIHCKKLTLMREEPLLGRNAHSARYGELIHDRTGKPVSVHHQETGLFRKFHHGQWRSRILWTKSKTKCETDRRECRTLQSQVTNIQ